MLFRIATLSAALLSAFTAEGAGMDFDYDHVELWGDIPGAEACNGKANSPIALFTQDCTAPQADYEFSPGTCGIDDYKYYVTKNGVQMELNSEECTSPTFKIPNIPSTYTHLQTHIHLSSEHSIDGGYFGAEMHMVHARVGNDSSSMAYAVVGTMIEPTAVANNPMFEAWLQRWVGFMNTASVCESCWDTPTIESYDQNVYQGFIGKDFWHYDGGLTTPPCSEAVEWNFTTEPMQISVRQYQMLTELILDTRTPKEDGSCKPLTVAAVSGTTSRPPMPLNGRAVVKYCSFS